MKCLRKYLIKCIKHIKQKFTRENSDKKIKNVDSYFSEFPMKNKMNFNNPNDKEEKIIEEKIEVERFEKNEKDIPNKKETKEETKEEKLSIIQDISKDKEKLTNSSSESSIIEEENPINLGINIGASKTVYSILEK